MGAGAKTAHTHTHTDNDKNCDGITLHLHLRKSPAQQARVSSALLHTHTKKMCTMVVSLVGSPHGQMESKGRQKL